ncbi:hypothetical protein B0H14DRAFT_3519882 [Mycena olivaceomarginata]|nr:hypothetical protein B0H14DRAFT_3519882 [Mycena olivaceomarginata]
MPASDFHRHRDVAVKPALVRHSALSCPLPSPVAAFFYRSPVAPPDLHIELSHYLNDRDHARAPHQLPFPPPSRRTLLRVIKSADQQASTFLHQKLKITEFSWTPPAPPIFAYVNEFFKGKQATLTCHETGSLVVQARNTFPFFLNLILTDSCYLL